VEMQSNPSYNHGLTGTAGAVDQPPPFWHLQSKSIRLPRPRYRCGS